MSQIINSLHLPGKRRRTAPADVDVRCVRSPKAVSMHEVPCQSTRRLVVRRRWSSRCPPIGHRGAAVTRMRAHPRHVSRGRNLPWTFWRERHGWDQICQCRSCLVNWINEWMMDFFLCVRGSS